MSNLRKPKFLILRGDGINCENETAWALQSVGAETQKIHINDLLENSAQLNKFQALVIPGGFSFGDELGSGQILALKLRHGLGDSLSEFMHRGKPILGICNGFQVLVKLGLLPFAEKERVMSLDYNASGAFIDCWPSLNVDTKSICKWTLLCRPSENGNHPDGDFRLPVRHGEGRVVFKEGLQEKIYQTLIKNGQIPLTYKENINGSYANIAAVCDESGLILGMMPHPEANVLNVQAGPAGQDLFASSHGQQIFQSIMHYLQ